MKPTERVGQIAADATAMYHRRGRETNQIQAALAVVDDLTTLRALGCVVRIEPDEQHPAFVVASAAFPDGTGAVHRADLCSALGGCVRTALQRAKQIAQEEDEAAALLEQGDDQG